MGFEGAFTALVTPFRDKQLDLKGLEANVRRQVAGGISGVVVLGTTGEAPTMSDEEKELAIKTVVDSAAGEVTVIVGTGSYSTKKTVEDSLRAQKLGANALLVVTPYYNKPSQEGIFEHFSLLAESVKIPIIVYNHPGRCGQNIETATLHKIASLPYVSGVKDASGDINQVEDVLGLVKLDHPNFSVLSGDDGMTLPLMALGGQGVVSVASNLFPSAIVELVSAMHKGNWLSARNMHEQLLPFLRACALETNPVPIKEAMNLCNLPAGEVRLPLRRMSQKNLQKLVDILAESPFVKLASEQNRGRRVAVDKEVDLLLR
ncbi:4-hydroxy-tetrahydrodipicolinate synthase [Simkania negevensis]|uniref:4-hydroxy-tetrahydrodipicolinate synthase n=1 Tax=Simkania negevensis TaxID=83561 RepID=A0ABS3ARB8_9BACT|nr:4-hydroxy-tetrahydrodipicolinate synthase [Simkania negevensis]